MRKKVIRRHAGKFMKRSSSPPQAQRQSNRRKRNGSPLGKGPGSGGAGHRRFGRPRDNEQNSARPGLCPTISKVFMEADVCSTRPRRTSHRRRRANLRLRRPVFAEIPATCHRACRAHAGPVKQGRALERDRKCERKRPCAPRRRIPALSMVF